jgi:hypothetical protein
MRRPFQVLSLYFYCRFRVNSSNGIRIEGLDDPSSCKGSCRILRIRTAELVITKNSHHIDNLSQPEKVEKKDNSPVGHCYISGELTCESSNKEKVGR